MVTRAIVVHAGELFDRPPPHHPAAERAILGALLLEPALTPEIRAALGSEPFYNESHADLYRRMLSAFDEFGIIDPVVMAPLPDDAANAISELCASQWFAAGNWPYYAKIVRDCATKRAVVRCAAKIAYSGQNGDTASEALAHAGEEVSAVMRTARIDHTTTLADSVEAELHTLESVTEPRSYTTGLAGLDATLGGGLPCCGIVVCIAQPGAGKTALVTQIVLHLAAAHKAPAVMFTWEMDRRASVRRMLQSRSGVPVTTLMRRGKQPDAEEWGRLHAAQAALLECDVRFYDRHATAAEVYAAAGAEAARGAKVAVIDYLQLLRGEPGRSEAEKLADAMSWARSMANDHGLLVFVVSQPTIAAAREDRPMHAGDGRGSGAIWDAADAYLSLYREGIGREPEPGHEEEFASKQREATVHVVKNKDGPLGVARLLFDPSCTRFADRRWT